MVWVGRGRDGGGGGRWVVGGECLVGSGSWALGELEVEVEVEVESQGHGTGEFGEG